MTLFVRVWADAPPLCVQLFKFGLFYFVILPSWWLLCGRGIGILFLFAPIFLAVYYRRSPAIAHGSLVISTSHCLTILWLLAFLVISVTPILIQGTNSLVPRKWLAFGLGLPWTSTKLLLLCSSCVKSGFLGGVFACSCVAVMTKTSFLDADTWFIQGANFDELLCSFVTSMVFLCFCVVFATPIVLTWLWWQKLPFLHAETWFMQGPKFWWALCVSEPMHLILWVLLCAKSLIKLFVSVLYYLSFVLLRFCSWLTEC